MTNVRCTIEIPFGSELKYELDKTTGKLFVDRAIYGTYPCCYGFVNNTLWDDGDALDIFLLEDCVEPPIEVCIQPIAVIELEDNGVSDTKLIGKIVGRQLFWNPYKLINNIISFLQTYKEGIVIKSVSIREKDIEKVLKMGYRNYWGGK